MQSRLTHRPLPVMWFTSRVIVPGFRRVALRRKKVQEACHAAGNQGVIAVAAAASGAPPGGRMDISTLRLALRPVAVAFDWAGLYCARPITDSRAGSIPLLAIRWT